MIAIPAMDIIDGSCVRLRMGDYAEKTVYHSNPVDMAKQFADSGLRRLHLVDLDGARAKHVVNLTIIERIANETPLILDVGGGLKTAEDLDAVFHAGAHMATVGSLAALDRELTLSLLETWGADKLILGADCKDGKIAVGGWSTVTNIPVETFVSSYLEAGFRKVISTDISRDGMLNGPSLKLYSSLIDAARTCNCALELIASGGIRNIEDLDMLEKLGLSGAIIGKALYEGAVTTESLAMWQSEREM